ncbi:MAG: tripartite tricarboxylate transporter TctB family protein [Spirochaetota bacterium]
MEEKDMPKADFVTSIVLIAFAIGVIWMSIEMPRLEHRNINPWSIPGLVPGILGVIILVLGITLLIRSIKQKGHLIGITKNKTGNWFRKPSTIRTGLTLLLTLGYAWGLIGRLPYPVATFMFVTSFIIIFEYNRKESSKKKIKRVLIAVATGAFSSAVVSVVFYYVFLVRLP